jgi:flavodoxin
LKPIILYASKSGNTQKIADSMANEIGCKTIRISNTGIASASELEEYDLIFLGTGLFAGTPNEDLIKYLTNLSLKNPKQFVLFITWGGAPRTDKMALARLTTILEGKGQKVHPEHFACYGGWKGILMKRGHPKPDEIAAAAQWAKNILSKFEKE